MTNVTSSPGRARLVWLDLARLLCALMILGLHWLHAGYNVGSFGAGDPVNLVMDYQGHSGGIRMLPYLFIAGTAPTLSTWLTNVIGFLGGFGWEAVSALILISGFSLAISQAGKTLEPGQWVGWFGKRAVRILVPFYLVAIPFLLLYAGAVVALRHQHGALAAALESKLLSQFHTPLLGVIASHLVLFDPFARSWSADFFAPAWWFIPAILLAYVAYPFLRAAAGVVYGIPLLCGTAVVTIFAYVMSDAGVLVNETWYYIVLHELFNFTLGIVLGVAWANGARPRIERLLDDPRAFAIAAALFVLGNLANWTPAVRPIASMLYGPSLVLIVVFLSRRLEDRPGVTTLLKVDSYDLYLVHQPFAFPIALIAKQLFHGYSIFIGWFVFVAVAFVAARLLAFAQKLVLRQPPKRVQSGPSYAGLRGEKRAS
jgi:peptidoglycan/LPS O-acetylase OafA/YrhL